MSYVDQGVVNFIRDVQPLCNGQLGQIQREALAQAQPIVPPESARFLATLISICKPKKVLEIGCAVGFSAGLMSSLMPEDGHITTIDRYDIMIKDAKENFAKLQLQNKVTLLEGDAEEILKALEDEYDFIFLDAAKGQYLQFLPHCLRLLKVGGVLLADDVLQEGRIARDRLAVPRRQRTIHTRMRKFLEVLTNTQGLESCIIPIGDGMALCHKTQEVVHV